MIHFESGYRDMPSQSNLAIPICIPSTSHELNDSQLMPYSEYIVLYTTPHVIDINVPPSPSNTLNVFVQLPDITNVFTLPSNTHTMVTYSKSDVFQPKAFIYAISPNGIHLEPIN